MQDFNVWVPRLEAARLTSLIKVNPYDNAQAKAGWSTLKTELLRWSNLGAQKQDVYFLSHEHKKQQAHAG